ncbi:MAG: ATP-dependent DNA helicase [Croceimicrobium sp.]|nr:AAA family ATPase [Bacteroidota bacterium]
MDKEWKRAFYYSLKRAFPHQPTQGQLEAFKQLTLFMAEARADLVFLLRGYAGTGKTSLIESTVESLKLFERKAVLMAPTGRAAKVMSNYAKRPAFTIHKYIYRLQTDKRGNSIFQLRPNKSRHTVFIVDEASMINDDHSDWSSSLLSDLLDFVKSGHQCKLLLVGDTAQLPPVGSLESPALDGDYLARHYSLDHYGVEMKEVMRQMRESQLLANATDLRNIQQELPYRQPQFNLGPDFIRLQEGFEVEDALNQALSEVGKEEMCIIVRSNKRANLYNKQIRGRILWQEDEVSTGDYLMVVKNNYHWLPDNHKASFIANGDILELLEIYQFMDLYDKRFARVKLRFTDYQDAEPFETIILLDTLDHSGPSLSWDEMRAFTEEVALDYQDMPSKAAMLKELKDNPYLNALQVKFAYAITGHKAQGGQWQRVFVEHPWRPDDTLDLDFLRWLYTAITRARERVYLLGFPNDFFPSQMI